MATLSAIASTARAQPTQTTPICAQSVELRGDDALVAAMSDSLASRGVVTRGDEPCVPLVVTVSSVAGKVLVVVTDPAGTDDARLVTDSTTASVFVESRVRNDLASLPEPETPSEPLSSSPIARTVPGPRPLPARATPRADSSDTVPDPEPSSLPPSLVALRLRPGGSVGSDGSSWLDITLHGCVLVEPICVGALLRGSVDLGLSGRSAELLTERVGLDALVTAELPIQLGEAMSLSPGLGVGAGWLRAEPRGLAEGPSEVEVVANFGSLRLDAFLRASWSIAPTWSLGASAFFTLDPLARTGDIRDPDAVLAGTPLLRAGGALEVAYGVP